jgi:branched-chain amino acid transport system substrate-binding protein
LLVGAIGVVRLSLAALILALCGCSPNPDANPVWVGCLTTLSGPDAVDGARAARGVELALADAGSPRVDGRPLAVIRVDDRGDDKLVRAEAVRLLSVNRAAGLIGGPDPARGVTLGRAAQPYGAPVVLPCETATEPPGEATFSLGVRPEWRGVALARYAAAGRQGDKVGVLIDGRDPIAVAVAAGFVSAWSGNDASVVRQWTFRSDAERDAQAAEIVMQHAALVLIAAGPEEFRKAHNRLRTEGKIVAVIYGGPDVDASPVGDGGAEDEIVMASVFATGGLTDHGKEFADRYRQRFHEAPDLAAAQGYDAARVLFEAMARAKSTDSERVRSQLADLRDFEGLTGPLSFKDRRARRPVFVLRLRSAATELVQTVPPESDDGPP